MTAESLSEMAPPYLCVVGDSWAPALEWRRIFSEEPFLGIRVDAEEVWVAFEPTTATGLILQAVFDQTAQVFGHAGNASISKEVFLYEAPSLGAAHRLARRVVEILQSGPYRPSPARAL